MPRRWSLPPSNGWIGSITAASSSPSAISLPLKPRRATMPKSPVRPWQPDSNKIASGKPGAVHRLRSDVERGDALKALINRVELGPNRLRVLLSLGSFLPASGQPLHEHASVLVREFPLRIQRRGVERKLVIDGPGAGATDPDPVLLKEI